MRPNLPLPAFPLLLLASFLAPGCIHNQLLVDIRTDVRADGSCTRRIEYRLERTPSNDREDGTPGYLKAPDQDPLRTSFRFPTGDRWTVRDEVRSDDLHLVVAEATLPSANDLHWDYWRERSPGAAPARNYLSFAATTAGSDAVYEYAETFRDPASPLAAARRLAEAAQGKDGAFADALARALEDDQLPRGPVRRAFREVLAAPLARRIAALGARPFFGPRERDELHRLGDEGPFLDFTAALHALLPRDPKALDEAVEAAMQEVFEPVAKDMAAKGLPLELAMGEDPASLEIRFRVTLVMPAAITRANTCFSGDTATWEFEQDDLYAGAFPMWAKAVAK
jgi:hypothetical protein